MDRQVPTKREREQVATDELAERLDALTLPLANRVLGRAIEFDSEARAAAEAAADTMDYDTLRDVAAEVGITEDSLKKAILEELDTDKDHNATAVEWATMPGVIRGGVIASGSLDEVVERIRSQLRSERAPHPAGRRVAWVGGGSGGPIEVWSVTQNRPDRHLVGVDVDTRPARLKAWRWIVGAFLIASLFGSAFGGLVFLGLFVAGIVTVVSWVKRVARGIRRTVNGALGAAVDEGGSLPSSWLDVWERTPD
ncbi:MAG TPA: hypothetical protein VGC47_03885 [Acidimicrobiia bacterium]